jgi:EAL and modified HD-GYP domain-containing signal transduction protein
VVLEIPPLGHAAAQGWRRACPSCMGLRDRGFHLAFNHTVLESAYAAWLPLADYIKLDLSVLARTSWPCWSATPPPTRPS